MSPTTAFAFAAGAAREREREEGEAEEVARLLDPCARALKDASKVTIEGSGSGLRSGPERGSVEISRTVTYGAGKKKKRDSERRG